MRVPSILGMAGSAMAGRWAASGLTMAALAAMVVLLVQGNDGGRGKENVLAEYDKFGIPKDEAVDSPLDNKLHIEKQLLLTIKGLQQRVDGLSSEMEKMKHSSVIHSHSKEDAMKRLLRKHQSLDKERYARVVATEDQEQQRKQVDDQAHGEREEIRQDQAGAAAEGRAPREHVIRREPRQPAMSAEGQRQMDEEIGMQIGKAISRVVAGTLKEEIDHVLLSEFPAGQGREPVKRQGPGEEKKAVVSSSKKVQPAAASPDVKAEHVRSKENKAPAETRAAAARGGSPRVAARGETAAAEEQVDPRKRLDELQSKVETLAAMERQALDNLPQIENKEALARSSIAGTLQSLRIAKDRSVLAQRAVDDDKVTSNEQQLNYDELTAQRASKIEDAVKRELRKELHRQAALRLEAKRGPLLARRLHLARKELREERSKMKRWEEEEEAQKLEENMNFAA